MNHQEKWDFSFASHGEALEYLGMYSDPDLRIGQEDAENLSLETPGTYYFVVNLFALRSAIKTLSHKEILSAANSLVKASEYLSQLETGLRKYVSIDSTNKPSEIEKKWRRRLRKQVGLSQGSVTNALRKTTTSPVVVGHSALTQ